MGKKTRVKLQEREEKVARQEAVLSGRHNYLVVKSDRSEITWGRFNDLTDYYAFALQNPNFDLKGRKIPALRKAMVAWHYDLARQRSIKGGTWPGLPVEGHASGS